MTNQNITPPSKPFPSLKMNKEISLFHPSKMPQWPQGMHNAVNNLAACHRATADEHLALSRLKLCLSSTRDQRLVEFSHFNRTRCKAKAVVLLFVFLFVARERDRTRRLEKRFGEAFVHPSIPPNLQTDLPLQSQV